MDRRSSRSGANVESLRDRERVPLQDSRGKADFLTIRVSSTIFVLDDGRATVHGFRAVASTLLNEMGFHPDWIERQLAHDERNKVRAAYIAKHAIILSALLAVLDDLWRKAVAAIADFLHPLGYRTASGTASPKRRDNAIIIVGSAGRKLCRLSNMLHSVDFQIRA